jgi:predicted metal-dependent hydrolase
MKSSPRSESVFTFGSRAYHYDLVRQDRKTLSLTVRPDLRIIVKCPPRADQERIESFLRRKWLWLEKQLRFFGKYQLKHYQKEYVSGESFLYLGRQYKLVVRRGPKNAVSLAKGILLVQTAIGNRDGAYSKYLITCWYNEKRTEVFLQRYREMLQKFDYADPPRLVVKNMKKRWGSFYQKNIVALNPKLIYCPKDCIDYVIVHELCHVRFKNHDKKFFAFLKKKCPRWEKIKDKLESIGIQNY